MTRKREPVSRAATPRASGSRKAPAPRGLGDRLFQQTATSLAILDRECRFVRVNRAWARRLGRPAASFRARLWSDLFPDPAPHGPTMGEAVEEVARTGQPVRISSWPLASSDAHGRGVVHCDLKLEPILDRAGNLEFFSCSCVEATEGARAERSLRNGERRYREIVDALPVALYATDAQGRLDLYNEAAVALWGRRPELGSECWCGCGVPSLRRADGRPITREETPLALAVREDRAIRGEEVVLDRVDGTRVILASYATPLHDERGGLTGAANVLIDYTERRRVEAALAESEERFRAAFEFAGIGMALLTIDGRWLRANRSLCAMLGYSEDELRRTTYHELTHPDDLPRGEEIARRLRAGEIPCMQIEKRYRRRDGAHVWARLTTAIVRSPEGEPLYYVSQIEDIHASRAAQDRLALVEFALDQVHEAAFLIDERACFRWVNDASCRSLGFSREELLSMGVSDIDPDWPVERWPAHWRSIQAEGSRLFESRHRARDGRVFPVELTVSFFEYGGKGYNLALARDITERRRADAAKRESEARYREVFENSPDIVFAIDVTPEGFRLVLTNPAWQRVTGLDGARVSGKLLEEVIPAENVDRVVEQYRRCLDAGVPISYEEEFATTAGYRHFHTTVTPIRTADGESRLFGVARDVTERKIAAEEWLLTFDALQAAVVMLDEQHNVLRVNRAALLLAACDAAALVGRRLADVVSGEPWATALAELAALDAAGSGMLRHNVTAGGRTWEVEARGLPPPVSSARRARSVLLLRDLSRLVALQESVRRAEHMAAMGALVAGVAHEVRNPLFAISVNIDALAAELSGRPDVLELVDALRAERDRLSTLMYELLAYGRPIPEERTLLPVEPVLASAVHSCASLAASRGVRIERRGVVDASAAMDPGRLGQVFENLIDNACRHAPAGSEIEVAASREQGPTGALLRVEVRDRGPGFAPDVLDHVFEPFFTRRRGGTGLGLSIAQRNAEAHGGRVSAGNRDDGGAVLRVELPLAGDR